MKKLKVKIIGADNKWYNEQIGSIFNVDDPEDPKIDEGKWYWLPGTNHFVLRTDCVVMKEYKQKQEKKRKE